MAEHTPPTEAAPAATTTPDKGRPVLVVDDVHLKYKTFGGKRRTGSSRLPGWARGFSQGVGAVDVVHAVKGVSFVAHHGESIGLIGHNGSGKSTLLRAVAGAMPVTSGAIYTDGVASLLGVSGALIKNLSGERNIILGCLALGLKPDEVAAHYEEVVEFADIGDFVRLPMEAYSSGMGARLRFAISTAASPDILMIDEALATGDASFKARSQRRIDEIRARAGTVLLVSHSMGTIKETCDRVLWLDSGVLRADGKPDEVIEAYMETQRAKVEASKK
ncbi:ATP-binding cassette domain-containing protein [Nocardioides zeae]|uniref:ABC transporter ATP-binding protein n=1 Tax=Nocardioides zeae TaxID=1457234 RepID=A0A6P0HGF0_9ACTN|nr:ABC transporter ATP-binding protein [Nocardioides zeae]